jgi:hypothetical protein
MKKFLMNLMKTVNLSVKRFLPAFCLIICLFLACAYLVVFDPSTEVVEIFLRIIATISFGILVCAFGKLLAEKHGQLLTDKLKIHPLIIDTGLLLLSGLSYFALADFPDNPYILSGYWGIMIALFMGIFYLSNAHTRTKAISSTFSFMLKNTMFNGFICLIITAGVALCIAAFDTLIYKFEDAGIPLQLSLLFVWMILFLNLSLSTIPRKDADDNDIATPAIFKIIVTYVTLPLFLLLISILLLYLGKILVSFSFPSGQVNWFASFASLTFIFLILSLHQYKDDNKLTKLFVKFGGYIMLPIMAMQFIAIYIRLSNYGLTTTRYISLVLNIVALVFVMATLIQNGRHIHRLLIAMVGVSLLLTLTPLNVLDVPVRDQTAKLIAVLNKHNMIIDGLIVANENIPLEDKIIITSTHRYLNSTDAHLPTRLTNLYPSQALPTPGSPHFMSVFGFSPEYEGRQSYASSPTHVYYSYNYIFDSLDVAEFKKVHIVSSGKNGSGNAFTLENTFHYDLTEDAEALRVQYGHDNLTVPILFQIDNHLLILKNLSFSYDPDTGSLLINAWSGFFLEK